MKRVAAREFGARASEYIDAGQMVEIEQDGRIVGRYVPVAARPPVTNGTAATTDRPRPAPDQTRELLEQANRAMERLLLEAGLTEEELVEYLDPSKPLPSDD